MHYSGISGSDKSSREIVDLLGARGHEVAIFFPAKQELSASYSGVQSVPVSGPDWWMFHLASSRQARAAFSLSAFHSVFSAIKKFRPDLVMTSSSVTPVGALTARILGVPHIWWVREFGDVDHDLIGIASHSELSQVMADLSTFVVFNSAVTLEHWEFTQLDKVRILNPVVRAPALPPKADGLWERDEGFSVGVFASLQPGKGHLTLLRALNLLREEGIPVRAHFYGAGKMSCFLRLWSYVDEMRLQNQVVFYGAVNDVGTSFGRVTAVVVPSEHEAFGRVPLEAAFVGRPVVYSNSSGLAEQMVPFVTGLPFEAGDAASLAEALKIIHGKSDFVEQLRLSARMHGQERLTATVNALASFVQELETTLAVGDQFVVGEDSPLTLELTSSALKSLAFSSRAYSALGKPLRGRALLRLWKSARFLLKSSWNLTHGRK